MARSDEDVLAPAGQPKSRSRTVAELLCYFPDHNQRQELEVFRAHHEIAHGPTDMTRRYTSTFPTHLQQWLFENQPQRWFDGLPDFVQAFLTDKIAAMLKDGQIDVSNVRDRRSHWIRTGPAHDDRIERDWISQYLGAPVRAAVVSTGDSRQRAMGVPARR